MGGGARLSASKASVASTASAWAGSAHGREAISQHAKEMLEFGEKLLLDSFHVAPASP